MIYTWYGLLRACNKVAQNTHIDIDIFGSAKLQRHIVLPPTKRIRALFPNAFFLQVETTV